MINKINDLLDNLTAINTDDPDFIINEDKTNKMRY